MPHCGEGAAGRSEALDRPGRSMIQALEQRTSLLSSIFRRPSRLRVLDCSSSYSSPVRKSYEYLNRSDNFSIVIVLAVAMLPSCECIACSRPAPPAAAASRQFVEAVVQQRGSDDVGLTRRCSPTTSFHRYQCVAYVEETFAQAAETHRRSSLLT